jgi:hypothetical protein
MKQTINSDPAPVYVHPRSDDSILFVRGSKPAPMPQPSAVDRLAEVVERLGKIEDRLSAIEAGQASAAVRLDDIEYNAGIAEDVRILVDQTVMPAVRDISDHLYDLGDALADQFTALRPAAAVIHINYNTDNEDNN